jgi:putative acyl-CoA dehydrogenase
MTEQLPARIDALANETEARRLAQDVALALQGALLAQTAPAAVTDAFCASRLGGDWGHAFGTLSARADMDAIVARAMP